MDDRPDRDMPKANKKRGKHLIALSAVIVVVVLAVALIYASGFDLQNSDDTSSDASEDELVSGVASDFILNQSDMGSDWIASNVDFNLDAEPMNASIISVAGVTFEKLNSTGHLEYQVDISVIIFNTTEDATTYYNKTAVADRPLQGDPGAKPEIPVIIANVSAGDGGIIVDGPHITLGHEAKGLYFIDKNVVCIIMYHHAWTYDPLPNELLIDLANKIEAKIA
jgi:hypothetical protein